MKDVRIVLAAAAALLAGCVQQRMEPEPIGPCRADEAQVQFVGERYRSELRDRLGRVTNSRIVRVLRADDMATMDMRPDRLNVVLGDDDRIAALRCG